MLLKFYLSTALLSIVLIFFNTHSLASDPDLAKGWLSIVSITILLVVLANLIRELKPVYTRYPVYFTYSPFIILASYPFILNTNSLIVLMNQILQGGALLITLLLYLTLFQKLGRHMVYFGGFLLLLITFLGYWFFSDSIASWMWHVTFASGTGCMTYGINELLNFLAQKES
ncbi:MAG: hypothetical protein WD315_00235 [Balneolaceae bacterium]